MASDGADFDMPKLDHNHYLPLSSSTPRYHPPGQPLGRRTTPRWIKIATSGTIGRFLDKWRSNPVQVSKPDGPHDFTSSQLPHLSECHAENEISRERNGLTKNGHSTPDGHGYKDRRSTKFCTIILVLLGLLLVLAGGGIPLLVAETHSKSNSSAVVSNDTDQTTSSISSSIATISTSTPVTNLSVNDQSSEAPTATSSINETTIKIEDTPLPTASKENSTSLTITTETTASPKASEENSTSPTVTTEDTASPTASEENSTSPTVTTEDTASPTASEENASSATITIEETISPTASEENSTSATTTETTVTQTTVDFTEEAYSVITGLDSYFINQTKIFYCAVYIQKLGDSTTNVSRVSLFKYANNSKNLILLHDFEGNVTSNGSSRFEVINGKSEWNVTIVTYSVDSHVDPGLHDECDLQGLYTCEFELSVQNTQQRFANTSLVLKGAPSDVGISLQSNYYVNTTEFVNCSAYVLPGDTDHLLQLGLHNDVIAISYYQYLNFSRDNTTIMATFPSINLTSSFEEGIRDCLVLRTNVYEVYFDAIYENLSFSCVVVDLKDIDGTILTVKSTNFTQSVVQG